MNVCQGFAPRVLAASSSIGSTFESAAPIFMTMKGNVKTAIEKSTAALREEVLCDIDAERREDPAQWPVREEDVEEPKGQIERAKERKCHHRPHELPVADSCESGCRRTGSRRRDRAAEASTAR